MRSWLLGLTCAALLGIICTGIAGEDSRVTRLTVGLVLILVLCAPASELRLADVSQILTQSRAEAEQAVSGVEVRSRDLMARIISEQTEAYILDKAKTLGMTLTVEVEVTQGETYPYPSGVTLAGSTTTVRRRQMNDWIRENLAIAEEHLVWKETDP